MRFRSLILAALVICSACGDHTKPTEAAEPDAQPFWVEQVASGLRFPSSIVWLPDGEALIALRGSLHSMQGGKVAAQPVCGMPTFYSSDQGDGLKDILVDPQFAENQFIYLYAPVGSEAERHAAVFRGRYLKGCLEDVKRIFLSKEAIKGQFSNSVTRMTMTFDNKLLLALPENGVAGGNWKQAQDLGSQIGKLLRINRDGSIPSDNPFRNKPGALPEIYSLGHRVQLGLYADREQRKVWEVEAGPRGGDELNEIVPGANYGWPKASWGFDYGGGLAAPSQLGAGLTDPTLVWTPSVTPAGITRLTGNAYAGWRGDFIVGTLTAQSLERLRIVDGRVVLRERLLLDLKDRIRDVKVGPDGLIYALTDSPTGRVLRLHPGQPSEADHAKVAHAVEHPWSPFTAAAEAGSADATKGKQAFAEKCAACHRASGAPGGSVGPDLSGVSGRRAGGLNGFSYSSGMRSAQFAWTKEKLDHFLADPAGLVPGTAMSIPPVSDAKERANIVSFLAKQ